MSEVFHLVFPSAWQASPHEPYRAASLETEGFIHCSYAEQVAASANRFYAAADELLVLWHRPGEVGQPAEGGAGRLGRAVPHVYGRSTATP